jgi:hypothetical protein
MLDNLPKDILLEIYDFTEPPCNLERVNKALYQKSFPHALEQEVSKIKSFVQERELSYPFLKTYSQILNEIQKKSDIADYQRVLKKILAIQHKAICEFMPYDKKKNNKLEYSYECTNACKEFIVNFEVIDKYNSSFMKQNLFSNLAPQATFKAFRNHLLEVVISPVEINDYEQSLVFKSNNNNRDGLLELNGKKLSQLKFNIQCDWILKIDLSSNHFFECPQEILTLSHLTVLSLRENRLKELPSDLDKLEKLEILNISKNQIEELPESIVKLSRLKKLRAGENKIKKIPDIFFSIQTLEEVDFERNCVSFINLKGVEQSKLNYFDANHNKLQGEMNLDLFPMTIKTIKLANNPGLQIKYNPERHLNTYIEPPLNL